MSNFIPVMKPKLPTLEVVSKLINSIDYNRMYSNNGPLVRELESAYATFLDVKPFQVVTVSNATLAIQGLAQISGQKNWIIPDYTFAATGLAILNANLNLQICDVRISDWKLDLDLVKKHSGNFGIIPVMPFGAPIEFNEYEEFDYVIIDAAASLGAKTPVFSEMRENWAVVFSLHATKVLGAGEGAIAICATEEMARSLRAWCNFGFVNERLSDLRGTNAKMPEITAAYGLSSLLNRQVEMEDWLQGQKFVFEIVDKAPWMTYVNAKPQIHPYWIAQFNTQEERDLVSRELGIKGIQTREWWSRPLSEQRAFKSVNWISSLEVSRNLASVHLGLPMFRDIDREEVSYIHESILHALR